MSGLENIDTDQKDTKEGPMNRRAESLADRIVEGADGLAAFAEGPLNSLSRTTRAAQLAPPGRHPKGPGALIKLTALWNNV
jgi:hypothetical protein